MVENKMIIMLLLKLNLFSFLIEVLFDIFLFFIYIDISIFKIQNTKFKTHKKKNKYNKTKYKQ